MRACSLAALALATAFEITPAHALEGLEKYVPPAGRGRILKGKNGSVLIDDSYNASPAAVEEALLYPGPGCCRPRIC